MGDRYYDPRGGQFLSQDSVSYPICIDLYTFANGDPVNYFDPDGRFASPVYQPIKETLLNTWNSPQFHGALQMEFGVSQVMAGVAYTAATGGFGGLAGGGLLLFRGLDDIYTGTRQIISNEWRDSAKSQLLQACGASRGFAEGVDTVSNFCSPKKASQMGSSFLGGLFGKKEEAIVQYTKSNLRLGQQVHKSYKAAIADRGNLRKEFKLPSGRRIDFLDIKNAKVYELKPNNPRAIRAGTKQLNTYIEELKTMDRFKEKKLGRDYRGLLIMDNKIFKKKFDDIAKFHGFESLFGGWFKESPECIFVIELMKSNFGNYYQLNIKVYVNGVFGKIYTKSKDLVKKDIGDIFIGEPREFKTALDLETLMDVKEREQKLQSLFKDFLVPFSEKALTKQGINELVEQGEIDLLPPVKVELEKLKASEQRETIKELENNGNIDEGINV